MVTILDQLVNHFRTYETCRTGDEDFHLVSISRVLWFLDCTIQGDVLDYLLVRPQVNS